MEKKKKYEKPRTRLYNLVTLPVMATSPDISLNPQFEKNGYDITDSGCTDSRGTHGGFHGAF